MSIKNIIESLSPHERKILSHLGSKNITEICRKSNLDKVSVIRALEYLQNKKVISLSSKKKKIVEIGVNGALYKKNSLPERRLLNILNEKRILNFQEAQKQSSLSNEEFKAAIGALKKKALIEIKNGKIILNANKEEISKKTLEESFIEALPLEYDSLTEKQLYSLKSLQARKEIIQIREEKTIEINTTDLGKEVISSDIKKNDLINLASTEIRQN